MLGTSNSSWNPRTSRKNALERSWPRVVRATCTRFRPARSGVVGCVDALMANLAWGMMCVVNGNGNGSIAESGPPWLLRGNRLGGPPGLGVRRRPGVAVDGAGERLVEGIDVP